MGGLIEEQESEVIKSRDINSRYQVLQVLLAETYEQEFGKRRKECASHWRRRFICLFGERIEAFST